MILWDIQKLTMKRFIIVALGLFLTILLILAVVGTFITDKSLNECFFLACCGVLYVTGMALGFTYGLVYLGGFIWLCQHYAMPLDNAFDLCYHELVQLSKDYHTTYYNVNYAIFIILFLATTIGNILLDKLIQKGHRQEWRRYY